ncbi:MAG: hypothetical protein OEY91_15080, partial [Nitrospirota bacterium]|nr:hypothetical protein [Nitrospirota bacterium]
MEQAPDTHEFRIYYHPGQMNSVFWQIKNVTQEGNNTSKVEFEQVNKQGPNAYRGATLRNGTQGFKIIASSGPGDTLSVTVRHTEITTSGQTADEISDGISVTQGKIEVVGINTGWSRNIVGRTLKVAGHQKGYVIVQVESPTRLLIDRPYEEESSSKSSYVIEGKLPKSKLPGLIEIPSDLREGTISTSHGSFEIQGKGTKWTDELEGRLLNAVGESDHYEIRAVDETAQKITLDQLYKGKTEERKSYRIRHPLYVDYTQPETWQNRIYVVGFNEHVTEGLRAGQDSDGNELSGRNATANNNVISLHPTEPNSIPDLSHLTSTFDSPFHPYVYLKEDTIRESQTYRIVALDLQSNTLTLDGTPNIHNAPSAWAIGIPVRHYDVFLPAPSEGFIPSLTEPIVYGNIGVSAADAKPHTKDKRNDQDWGNRPGNEGRVAGMVKIVRVLREKIDPPEPPDDSERVFATPADYHGKSYYTYRWVPKEYLKVHIYRALDDTLFNVDWERRAEAEVVLSADTEAVFPEKWRGSDPSIVEKRKEMAKKLNELNNFQRTDEGKKLAKAYFSEKLSDEELRMLASLPGNEKAFTQITLQPLDPADSNWENKRGPSDSYKFKVRKPTEPVDKKDPNYPLNEPNLKIYTDSLDGRSTNRYFYRAAYVDSAHNLSALSLSSPPVWLAGANTPNPPIITRVETNNGEVRIFWMSNRRYDLKEYRIYRAATEETARFLRFMRLVHQAPVQGESLIEGVYENKWIDKDVIGGFSYWYRIEAMDA